MKYAFVLAAMMALAPAMSVSKSSASSDPDCRGECVGNGNRGTAGSASATLRCKP